MKYLLLAMVVACGGGTPTGATCPTTDPPTFQTFGDAFFADYCRECHSVNATNRHGAETGEWRELTTARFSHDQIAVQAAGCAPIVRAFEAGAATAEPFPHPFTVASGLRVPAPFADALMLRAIRESGGTAIAVSEEEMLDGMREMAESEGCFACPEGGATLAALRRLRASGEIPAGERVVIYNTGSGLKYPEAWRAALARRAQPAGTPS